MNDDEFDDEFDDSFNDEASFDDFEQNSLGDIWRNNPMIKVGAILAATVTIFGAITLFGGGNDKIVDSGPSVMAGGSDITSTPGTEASPVYREAIADFNRTEVEVAEQTGGSAIPVPIEPPVANAAPLPERDFEDPLERWKRLQEERKKREQERAEIEEQYREPFTPEEFIAPVVAEPVDTNEIIQQMAEAMSEQMSAILENTTEKQIGYQQISAPDYMDRLREEEAEKAKEEDDLLEVEEAEAEAALQKPEKILISAGVIEYGQLLIEANSDIPGPVLAVVMSGPLAKSRIIGSFETRNNLITLSFNTIVVDGVSKPIDAIALDPSTSLSGMATEVDRRYFKRVILPMAATFIEGMAGAIAESGLTTVIVEGDTVTQETAEKDNEQEVASGIDEAGQKLGLLLDEITKETKTLVRIEAGTPLGILFLEPVTDGIEENDT